ncbi:MAG: acyltransferase family protein [Pseudomonadota bacterium]
MSISYRPEVDGLRALAVIPVILFHAGFVQFSGGFVGVDVFFVISGYLITSIIAGELAEDRFSLIHFYERRARRILPALVLVIIATLPFAWFWLMPADMRDFMQSIVAAATFSSNILFWFESGYFDTAAELKPLLHTWSLAVEEQYYILFPLLLMLAWPLGKRRVVILLTVLFVGSFGLASWASVEHPDFAFYWLPTRAWQLLIGVMAALYLGRRAFAAAPRWLAELAAAGGLALILCAVFVFDEHTRWPGALALVPTVGTVLVILYARPGTVGHRLLASKIPVGIGLVSYSAYLWHVPIFALFRHRSLAEPDLTAMAALCVLSLALAYLSWRFVEVPFRNKRLISRPVIFTFAGVACSALMAVGITGHVTAGWSSRLAPEIAELGSIRRAHFKQRDDGGCNQYRKDTDLGGCVWGADVTPKFALIGDSHASTVVAALADLFAQQGISFVQYTKNGCPLAQDFVASDNRRCQRFRQNVLSDLDARGITHAIVLSQWSHYLYGDERYENGVGGIEARPRVRYSVLGLGFDADAEQRRLAILRAYEAAIVDLEVRGIRTIIVGPIPEHAWDVPTQLAKQRWLDPTRPELAALPNEVYEQRHATFGEMLAAMAERASVNVIDPYPVFCREAPAGCASVRQGSVLYYDDDHLSNDGASLLVAAMRDDIRRARLSSAATPDATAL